MARATFFGTATWILVLVFASALPAQGGKVPSEQEVSEAIARAAEIIVAEQEAYDPATDPKAAQGRGRTPDPKPRDGRQPKGDAEKSGGEAAVQATPREWPYEGVYRVAPGILPPGYRVGGTAICCLALLETPGFATDPRRRAAFDRGIAFVLEFLATNPLMDVGFLGTYDVRGWGHSYALATLLRGLERKLFDEATTARATERVRWLVDCLQQTEIPGTGGWNYSRPRPAGSNPASTFMTAPTLQALFAAKRQGFAVDAGVVERALKTIEDARLDNHAFQYGTDAKRRTGKGFEAVEGACARMAVCETTLLLGNRGSVGRVRAAVDAFFAHWEHLETRRKKTGTHVPPFMIAPYYFHYGHSYAAQGIELLPAAERPDRRRKLRELYWRTRGENGGWNDRVFPRSENFGCAMAILGLSAPTLPAPARWTP